MQKIFSCLYGSKLYGTSTPASDRDIKHIVLPTLNDLLLGKKVSNVVKKTNSQKNTRNTLDDVDEEFIPIQVFARDFMMGQTYALEMAYALEGNHAEQTFYNDSGVPFKTLEGVWLDHNQGFQIKFIDFVQELRSRFLTSNIKAMMGYVVNQASLYSFKGERLNVAREFLEILKGIDTSGILAGEISLNDVVNTEAVTCKFKELAEKYPKYFQITEYDIGQNRQRPCFQLLEKTFPHTNMLEHSITVAENLIARYGTRADAASESNVDWKAMMHALRIVDEGLAILKNHKLEFPFHENYVEHLLSIKRGEANFNELKLELATKLDELKELEKTTSLPPTSETMRAEFEEFMVGWLRKFYNV